MCLCRNAQPLDIVQLPFTGSVFFVLVNPKFEAPTREMRAALPADVPFRNMVSNSVAGGSLVSVKPSLLCVLLSLLMRASGPEALLPDAMLCVS